MWSVIHDWCIWEIIPANDHITDSKCLDNKSNKKYWQAEKLPILAFPCRKASKILKLLNEFGESQLSLIKKERETADNIDIKSFTSAEPADKKDQHVKTQFSNCDCM